MPHALSGPAPGSPAVPDGVLVIDKPEGPTSHDVVARIRRALGVRQVGHTGTLDPMATGVLALVIGRATRLAQFLSCQEKAYFATVRLGVTTDTWDRTGAVLHQVEPETRLPDAVAIEQALGAFLGEQPQAPPPFSAKKIAGVRAHELARKGRPVQAEAALVTLHSATITAMDLRRVHLEVRCSAGYYVRALAHELGRRLGCGACLDALRRTASGDFTIERALRLEAVEEAPKMAWAQLVGLEDALPALPALVLTEAAASRVLHGNDVGPGDWAATETGPGRASNPAFAGFAGDAIQLLSPGGQLLAIARPAARPGFLHPAVVLK